jgi:hypothetical protein
MTQRCASGRAATGDSGKSHFNDCDRRRRLTFAIGMKLIITLCPTHHSFLPRDDSPLRGRILVQPTGNSIDSKVERSPIFDCSLTIRELSSVSHRCSELDDCSARHLGTWRGWNDLLLLHDTRTATLLLASFRNTSLGKLSAYSYAGRLAFSRLFAFHLRHCRQKQLHYGDHRRQP